MLAFDCMMAESTQPCEFCLYNPLKNGVQCHILNESQV